MRQGDAGNGEIIHRQPSFACSAGHALQAGDNAVELVRVAGKRTRKRLEIGNHAL